MLDAIFFVMSFPGTHIKEFIGLRPKMYSMIYDSDAAQK